MKKTAAIILLILMIAAPFAVPNRVSSEGEPEIVGEVVDNSARLNPIDLNRESNGDGVDYTSSPVYFAIKYTGSQIWVDDGTTAQGGIIK